MTDNPLARSRLEAVLDAVKNGETFHLNLSPNQLQTIRAALQHLLNPNVMERMEKIGRETLLGYGNGVTEMYIAMTTELTREPTQGEG